MDKAKNWKDDIGKKFTIRVTPKASSNYVKAKYNEDGTILLRVYVTSVPEHGKANDAVIKLLAKELGIAKSRINITKGNNRQNKTVTVI